MIVNWSICKVPFDIRAEPAEIRPSQHPHSLQAWQKVYQTHYQLP